MANEQVAVERNDSKAKVVDHTPTAFHEQLNHEQQRRQTPQANPEFGGGRGGNHGSDHGGRGPGGGRPEPPHEPPVYRPIPNPGHNPGNGHGNDHGNGHDPGRNPDHGHGHDPVHHRPYPGPIHGGGFNHRPPFHPPHGHGWGFEDPARWLRGFDPWFWRGDPNYGVWDNNLRTEAQYIGGLLNQGDAVDAANVLNNDLFQMSGDIYAQDELIRQTKDWETRDYQVNPNPYSADLYLGSWNPYTGTWNNMQIDSPSQGASFPVQTFAVGDPPPYVY